MNRRNFLLGAHSLVLPAAPAIVSASSLMKVRPTTSLSFCFSSVTTGRWSCEDSAYLEMIAVMRKRGLRFDTTPLNRLREAASYEFV